MPTYEYLCPRCGQKFERFWTSFDMKDPHIDTTHAKCECGVDAKKVPTLIANTPDKWHGGWRK